MNQELSSTALYGGKTIDCRCLTLAFEFYQLSCKRVVELAAEAVSWISNNFPSDNFYGRHYTYGKRNLSIPRILSDLQNLKNISSGWMYSFEAFAISPIVYNSKTMNTYLHELRYGRYSIPCNPGNIPIDYLCFWNQLFPHGKEPPEQVKIKILKLFNQNGRKAIKNFYQADVQARFSVLPYANFKDCYRGSFNVDLSAFCLGNSLQCAAELFLNFAKHLSEQFVQLNARIMLQPVTSNNGHSPYSHYFGVDGSVDNSHIIENCTPSEWYTTYYLPGVEWMNILSPKASVHLPTYSQEKATQEGVLFENLSGGGLLVGAMIPINEYDIADAKKIKSLLYPSLYPGRSNYWLSKLFSKDSRGIPFVRTPRRDWEVVPIFEDEVDIISTYLTFSSL